MRIALFGPPGAGKGTQAALLSEAKGLTSISTGNLIRWAIAEGSDLGREADRYVASGQLVPDALVRQLADSAIASAGFDNYILDGYPRTIQQGEWLDEFLRAYKADLQAVIFLYVPDEVIVERLSKRRINRLTGESYHLDFHPPPADVPSEDIIQRRDDQPEAIVSRLVGYREETSPLLDFYRKKGLLREVNGVCSVGAVHERIMEQLSISTMAARRAV